MSIILNANNLRILLENHFPPTRLSFVYGSAAFAQSGRTKGKMLDIVFAVDDTEKWHSHNIRSHPEHYSAIRHLPSSLLLRIQRGGAGIFYNPFVTLPGWDAPVKYGVISAASLKRDLEEWSTLYVSGRMHKPVCVLDISQELSTASDRNLTSALRTALLMLPVEFRLRELFVRIAGISYRGDVRVGIAEDVNKVENIVTANYDGFKQLYETRLETSFRDCVSIQSDTVTQDKSDKWMIQHLNLLPNNVVEHLCAGLGIRVSSLSRRELASLLFEKGRGNLPQLVEKSLENIIRETSLSQSAKGLLTAGGWKSLVYTFQKIKKRFNKT